RRVLFRSDRAAPPSSHSTGLRQARAGRLTGDVEQLGIQPPHAAERLNVLKVVMRSVRSKAAKRAVGLRCRVTRPGAQGGRTGAETALPRPVAPRRVGSSPPPASRDRTALTKSPPGRTCGRGGLTCR